MGSRSRRYKQWLAEFKEQVRERIGSDGPSDELDGWLNHGDFRGYYEEGYSPADAAAEEVSYGI